MISLTNVPRVVHEAVAGIRVLRGLAVPSDVVGHASKVVPAVCERAARQTVRNADLAACKPEVPGHTWLDVECARSPTPAANV